VIVESRDAKFFENKLSKAIFEHSNLAIEINVCHKNKLLKVLKGIIMFL